MHTVAAVFVCFSSLFICSAWHFIFSLEDVEGFFACCIIIKFNVKIMGFGVARKLEDTRGNDGDGDVTLYSFYAHHTRTPQPDEMGHTVHPHTYSCIRWHGVQ